MARDSHANLLADVKRKGQKITNERILSFYKKLFGEALESNAEVASYKEYRKTKKELAEKAGGHGYDLETDGHHRRDG